MTATEGEKKPGKLPLAPLGMLIVFTIINLLSYFDRGALSGMLDDIAANLDDLSESQKGFLGTAFMIGYCVGSPVMAHMVHHVEPFFVFSAGLAMWVVATFVCGIAPSYWPLLIGRISTGFGEAGFLCIVPPLLDRIAPNTSKSLWLSVFYASIPVGYAIGFGLSGIILDAQWWGENTWRLIFIGEALLMIPFVLFGLTGRSPYSFSQTAHHSEDSTIGEINENLGAAVTEEYTYQPDTIKNNNQHIAQQNGLQNTANSFAADQTPLLQASPSTVTSLLPVYLTNPFLRRLYALFVNPLYLTLVLGYSAQTFVTGGFAFYGISYVKYQFNASRSAAGMIFGGVTILAGIIGTLLGGIILDMWRKEDHIPSSMKSAISIEEELAADPKTLNMTPDELDAYKIKLETHKNDLHNPNMVKDRLQSIELAYRLVILATSIAIPFALLCFLVSNIWLFAILIFCAEFTLFTCLSVLNSAIIWCVPFNLSPQAIAFSVVVVHVLGDSLSPSFIGLLLDVTNKSYRSVMIICCAPLAIAIGVWAIGSGKVLGMLKAVRFYVYSEQPLYLPKLQEHEVLYNTANDLPDLATVEDAAWSKDVEAINNNNQKEKIEALRPFVEIRSRLQWNVAETCH